MDLFYTDINEFNYGSKYNNQHKAGRYIIEYVARNVYEIENSEIEIVNNKPKFKHSDIKFSITHSNNIAMVCFSNYPVGIDLEKMTQRKFLSIAKRMNLYLEDNSIESFYKAWTLYEAEYKLQTNPISRYSMIFEKDYMLSIATNFNTNIKDNLRIIKID